jgi:hypothetical protein
MACFLVAWGLVLLVWPLVLPDVLSFDGILRIAIVLLAVGGLLSLPYALDWLRGGLEEPSAPKEDVRVREVEGSGGSTYVVVTGATAGAAPATAAGRSVRVKDVGPGWYLAYMLVWRGPVTLGDALLTGIWNGVGRLQGRSEDRYPMRSTDVEGVIEVREDDGRYTGEF